MRCYGGGQVDQGEVLDDCCHVISTLEALCSGPKSHIIIVKNLRNDYY